MNGEQIADLLNYALIAVLVFSLFYVLCIRFANDRTLWDQMLLPSGDPNKLTYYIEPPTKDHDLFPTVFDPAEVYASFVVPAYNEEKRICPMLDDTIRYLNERESADKKFTWEIIVVDDGSKDRTADIVIGYARNYENIRLLKQPVNMGKGAAIQAGCLHARGELILIIDADGATKVDEFANLERKLLDLQRVNREAVVVGSRAELNESQEAKANRTLVRDILGKGFHILILISGVRGIKDTQCGFKLFSREAARWLFPNQHIKRWCFDPELLVIARKRNMQVAEVPVEWNEIDGSKMKVSSMIKMAIDLLQIAVFHTLGFWTVRMRGNMPINIDEI